MKTKLKYKCRSCYEDKSARAFPKDDVDYCFLDCKKCCIAWYNHYARLLGIY